MQFNDYITELGRYGLTGKTGIYNEDNTTAQQLNMLSARKIRECLRVVYRLGEKLERMELVLEYSYENKELSVGMEEKINDLKNQINSSYVCVFNEDAMTQIELAGNTAKAVNECLKAVNMLADLVNDLDKLTSLHYTEAEKMLILGGEE